jgi:hypothetical protein
MIGPVCNDAERDALIEALMNKKSYTPKIGGRSLGLLEIDEICNLT